MSQLTITIIQANLHWEDRKANLEKFENMIANIATNTEVVILPEMFNTGFSMRPEGLAESMEGETLQWMKRVSSERRIILTGSLIIEEHGNFYNRLVWMLPNGQFGTYDKRHRFAFAGEDKEFTAGTRRLIAAVKGWRINLLVCYDLRFPVWSRQQVKSGTPEYDVLVYVANWPERRSHAWKTLLQARAIENQCFVVGVNRVGSDGNDIQYNGNSTIVDPMGTILHTKEAEEEVFTITLDKSTLETAREKFPFWRDADEFRILSDE